MLRGKHQRMEKGPLKQRAFARNVQSFYCFGSECNCCLLIEVRHLTTWFLLYRMVYTFHLMLTKTMSTQSHTNAKSYHFTKGKTIGIQNRRAIPIVTSRTIIYSGVWALTIRSQKRSLLITTKEFWEI
jgi:hypothetical protein